MFAGSISTKDNKKLGTPAAPKLMPMKVELNGIQIPDLNLDDCSPDTQSNRNQENSLENTNTTNINVLLILQDK